jgi:hypothetical protein
MEELGGGVALCFLDGPELSLKHNLNGGTQKPIAARLPLSRASLVDDLRSSLDYGSGTGNSGGCWTVGWAAKPCPHAESVHARRQVGAIFGFSVFLTVGA